MKKAEFHLRGGIFFYVKEKEGISILEYQGNEVTVEVPKEIENIPVTGIGKKAFLSNKKVRRVILPETVKIIENWAFSHCSQLESVTFSKDVVLGKGAFLDCVKLRKIHLCPVWEEAVANCIPFLLAAVPVMLDADYLFVHAKIGVQGNTAV